MKNFQIKSAVTAFLLLFTVVFTACDNDDDEDDAIQPTIAITSPTESQEVKANQTLNITGTIIAENTLHGYIIYIRKKSDNTEVFKKEIHDHNTNITINHPWTVDAVTTHTDLELEVVATLDHEGNTISKKVNFHAMP